MLKKLTPIALLAVFLFSVNACTHDPFDPIVPDPGDGEDTLTIDDPCHPDTVYFADEIAPIFASNCAFSGCHDQGTAQNGQKFNSYANIMDGGAIVPGDSSSSLVYFMITLSDSAFRMPKAPNNALTREQIDKIGLWIQQGALNNGCVETPEECDTDNVTFSGTVFSIIENKCQGCHSGTSPGGGINLANYDDISTIAGDGRLEGVINHLDGFKAMPLGGTMLPSCEIKKITAWIADGAQDN